MACIDEECALGYQQGCQIFFPTLVMMTWGTTKSSNETGLANYGICQDLTEDLAGLAYEGNFVPSADSKVSSDKNMAPE